MPLSGSAFWALILPVEQTNLITNPSFERGTVGWGTIQAGTIGTASNVQQFGAWSGSVAPTSNGTAGAVSPTWTALNGSAYTISCYVRGANGIPYRMAVADSAGVNFVAGGTTTFTGGGTWHRVSFSYTEPAGATRTVVTTKNSSADTSAFYLDGMNATLGSLTTHIDGDQDGCYWLGAPHASQSTRSGTYRGGGSVVALADLGLKPNDNMGIGMPPQDVTAQSYALQAGAEYQRSRASERPFTLSFQPILGTTLQGFHATRRTIENALKPDLLDPQQPVRFWYTGGQGTVQIDAVYQSGLELGQMNGAMAEDGAIKFIAHDPYWTTPTQEGTSLAGRVGIGSTNYIAKRDPLGRWGTLGANGTTIMAVAAGGFDGGGVHDLAMNQQGTLFFCGSWGSVAGTQSPNIGMYFPTTNAFGTLTGGTLDNAVGPARVMQFAPSGTLYIGGNFDIVAGTSCKCITQWNGAYGTLIGGTIGHGAATGTDVRSFAINQTGTLFFGGRAWTSVGGTASAGITAFWYNGSFGTMTSSIGIARGIAIGLDNRVYVAGPTIAGGTTVNAIAQWVDGSWGSMGGGLIQSGAIAKGVAIQPNGKLASTGAFLIAGSGTAPCTAEWNGVAWAGQGDGLGVAGNISLGFVTNVTVDQTTGDWLVGGRFNSSGSRPLPDGFARWNGYTWLPMDIDLAGNGTVNSILVTPDQTIYAAGTFWGTAQAAAVAQVTNTGMAEAYPVLKLRNISAGTVRPYQIVNTSPTGDGIYFNLVLQPGEEVTLITEPGKRSFTSTFQGNVFGRILGGSNIAGFRLMPGTNYVSLFCDSGSVAASLYWTPRSDSVDGGTTY